MSTVSLKRCLVAVAFGAGICFLFANRMTTGITTQAQTAGININEIAASRLLLPPSESPGNTVQGKNPFVAEWEKKIAGKENKPAEEVYQNIKIFKGMPAIRVLRIMEVAFNTGLGVNCTHCHTPEQWEKDDKYPKETARKMWGFQAQINSQLREMIKKENVGVNCTTCHRGQVKPALNLPPAK